MNILNLLTEWSKSKPFLSDLLNRNSDWKDVLFLGSRSIGPRWLNEEGAAKEEASILEAAGPIPFGTKAVPILYPCYATKWETFEGNKFYFDDTPIDLPKNGKWKYRLPVTYDLAKKTFQANSIDTIYPNVSNIKIEDRSKGGFRETDHYFVRSNGEVWIKGNTPYLNLAITVNWKNDSGGSNSTRIEIPPDDFILNGKLISVSDRKVRVPYRPCYEGFENLYEIKDYVVTFNRKVCHSSYDTNDAIDSVLMNGPSNPAPPRFNPDGTLAPWSEFATFKEGIFAYTRDYTEETVEQTVIDDRGNPTGQKSIGYEIVEAGASLKYIGGKTWGEAFKKVNKDTGLPLNGYTQNAYEPEEDALYYLSASIETRTTTIKEYTNQTRFSDLLNCECIELNIITPPTINRFLTPDCDCTVTVSEEIYIICPDQFTTKAYNEYLNGRQTPPEIDDLIDPNDPLAIEPTYRRIITADPCEFGDDSSRVWQRFASRDIRDIVKNEIDGLFDGQETIDCYSTGSTQNELSKAYYYDVTKCDICEVSKSYFSVSFGHYAGSGSLFESFEDEDSPSRSIFSQYRLKALDDFSENFTYYNNGSINTSNMIYVMTFNRNSIKDRIDPGNFQINLSELNGTSYSNNFYTGSNVQVSSSNKILSLIDNSDDLTEMRSCSELNTMYSFDIVSGSLSSGIHSSGVGNVSSNANLTTYGKVYPNLGVIVLDGDMLNSELNFNTVTGSNINGDNHYKLFTSLSGSAALVQPSKFRNSRQRNIKNYSVRIAPVECNVSNNPTYLKEYGRLKYACFIENPVTYITTVGLYNSAKELLAIAKLSKPIKKTKDDTVDIKIRLGL
jgi:hypothetical protein